MGRALFGEVEEIVLDVQCLKKKNTTTIFLSDNWFQLTVVTQCKQVVYVSKYNCVVDVGELVSEKTLPTLCPTNTHFTHSATLKHCPDNECSQILGLYLAFPGAHIEWSIL